MPYFDQQKVWVKEGWKKKGPEINTSIVAKPQVQSRMDKDWTKLLGSAADHLMDINVDADLKEIFMPMFWSMGSGTTKLYYSTDYCLTEFMMLLEGNSTCLGFKLQTDDLNDGWQNFCDKILQTSPKAFLKRCQQKGWLVQLTPGKVLGIPPGHVYLHVADGECHGARILKHHRWHQENNW